MAKNEKSVCPDCGCRCEEVTSGKPPQTVIMSLRNGKLVYHDNSECIFHLKNRLESLAIIVQNYFGAIGF